MPDVSGNNAVVIGASAGGLGAVSTVISGLPRNFSAAVFIVIHTSPEGPGLLSSVLDRVGPLPVTTARHGESIREAHIYVPPPDRHLIIERGRIGLTRGPREHRFRPAIDPLFRSAAEQYGGRLIGIVLSGNMADGTHGLMTIKRAGGMAIVQDPSEAEVPAMPMSALRGVEVDYVLRTGEIGPIVTELVMNGHASASNTRSRATTDPAPSAEHPGPDAFETGSLNGPPSPFTCPDCGGSLWESKNGTLVRYRCHVGHGSSGDSLVVAQDEKLEDTLWSALRAIEESIELRKRMADRLQAQNLTMVLSGIKRDISDYERRADALRQLLLERDSPNDGRSAKAQPRRKRKNDGKKKTR